LPSGGPKATTRFAAPTQTEAIAEAHRLEPKATVLVERI
jgi:hypothetical protein